MVYNSIWKLKIRRSIMDKVLNNIFVSLIDLVGFQRAVDDIKELARLI